MRRAALPLTFLAAAALLAGAPTAQACSLAYLPFDQAQWAEGLHFVDGDRLVRVEGALERTVVSAFFLSYAPTEGGGLLVAGQDGLGAGCEGHAWLRLYSPEGAVAWQDDGQSRVFPHLEGPIVVRGQEVLRYRDGALEDTGWDVPEDVYVEGITAEGKPVYQERGQLVVGDWTLPSSDGAVHVAHDGERTAVLQVEGGVADAQGRAPGTVHLRVLAADGSVAETAWSVADAYEQGGLAHADGWLAAAGGRAFFLSDAGLTDLGVADVVAVGADGARGLVFTADGYTVFEDGRPTSSWQRTEGAWTPTAPPATATQSVSATSSSGTAAEGPGDEGSSEVGIPGAPAFLMVVALALLVAVARRRR